MNDAIYSHNNVQKENILNFLSPLYWITLQDRLDRKLLGVVAIIKLIYYLVSLDES